MRSLFLVLLLANLVLFAAQFDVVVDLIRDRPVPRADQINAERLRIIRDTSALPRAGSREAVSGKQ